MRKERKAQSAIHVVGDNHVHSDFKNLGKVGHNLEIGKATQKPIKIVKQGE